MPSLEPPTRPTARSRQVFVGSDRLTVARRTPPMGVTLAHLWMPVLLVPSWGGFLATEAHRSPNLLAMASFMAGTFAVYTGDRLLHDDGPGTAASRIATCEGPLLVAAVIAGVLAVGLAISGWRDFGTQTLALVVISALYAFIRWIPFGKTVAVAAAWMLALHTVGNAGSWTIIDASVAIVFAMGTAACDLKDVERDRERRVVSIPTLTGPMVSRIIIASGYVLGAMLAWVGHAPWIAAVAVAQAAAPCLHIVSRPIIGPLIIDAWLVATASTASLVSNP